MKSKFIHQENEIISVIESCEVCYVAMVDENNMPYNVALNFGYHNGEIYLHSAQTGKKMDILRKNPNVCVVMSTGHQLKFQSEKVACSYGMKYKSVVIHGKIEFIKDFDQKVEALNIIMQHYTGNDFTFGAPAVNEVCCYKIKVEKIQGRQFGY